MTIITTMARFTTAPLPTTAVAFTARAITDEAGDLAVSRLAREDKVVHLIGQPYENH
jgi:hypothetical protein